MQRTIVARKLEIISFYFRTEIKTTKFNDVNNNIIYKLLKLKSNINLASNKYKYSV